MCLMVGVPLLVSDFHFAEDGGLVQAAVNGTGVGRALICRLDRRLADQNCLTFFLKFLHGATLVRDEWSPDHTILI